MHGMPLVQGRTVSIAQGRSLQAARPRSPSPMVHPPVFCFHRASSSALDDAQVSSAWGVHGDTTREGR